MPPRWGSGKSAASSATKMSLLTELGQDAACREQDERENDTSPDICGRNVHRKQKWTQKDAHRL